MTALAGFLDAIGYTAMGHLFVSFMSGNSTQLGMAIAEGNENVIIWASAVIATFVLGAFLGTLIYAVSGRARVQLVLACELICFLLAAGLIGLWPTKLALLFISTAMGMQNAIHETIAGVSTGKSYITGTLVGIGEGLARAWIGKARLSEAGTNAASWLAFATGVVIGTVALAGLGISTAIVVACGVLITLMALAIEPPVEAI
ncbi:YoaK family protein [Hyphomicrobium sp.]|uniref:YoaK family protein n=1 Tax=Hyphomicrobium sp. TaxID=82 RepID=UPI002D7A3A3E|nr:YoaK family protein [Hyphomicrobium sp.]HET6389807.1 YoaK family protein [Hyphomicrobium sp.]